MFLRQYGFFKPQIRIENFQQKLKQEYNNLNQIIMNQIQSKKYQISTFVFYVTYVLYNRFVFNTGEMKLDDVKIGDSISVNGVCLSVIEKTENSFSVDISEETLSLTTFSSMKVNAQVNLEKAMTLSSRINGHMISGHIDGVGHIVNRESRGNSIFLLVEFPIKLERLISKKGSVSVDGVSLTVNEVEENNFSINIIPHTLSKTIFSEYKIGTKVNIEIDLVARYLEKLVVK